MKKFWQAIKILLMILGGLFLVEIILIAYVLIADPFNLRALLGAPAAPPVTEALPTTENAPATPSANVAPADPNDRNPALNADQEAALQAIGVDPATLPSELTAEQEACMREAVGADRAAEIEAGISPTAFEFLKASRCL
jgi:hypothetical protein